MNDAMEKRISGFTALLFALVLAAPVSAPAADTVAGYTYQFHNARIPPSQFDADPSSFKSATIWAAQGPHYTLTWGSKDKHTVKRASFARGMMRMGLYIPHWDFSRPSSSADGWMDYGRPLEYKDFSVSVKPGDGTRTIDGETAKHYTLHADFMNRDKGEAGWLHTTIDADLWALADKPSSWAAFSTAGIYGDPRLDAALTEQLAKLGMVVRVATRYHRQPISPKGKKLGNGRDGSYLSWISDIKAAQVPDVQLVSASYQTTRELQHAMWADGDGNCKTLLAGGTPDFVKKMLQEDQQAPYLAHMRASCERRAKRKQHH